jgi:hypothetical protein
MKKFLLFVMMCVFVSMDASAYSLSMTTYDGSTFAASDEGGDTQVLTVTAGGIAAWYANATDAEKGYMADNASRVKLKITGTLNNDDLQVLGEACFNKFTSIDMSGATLADGASISNIKAGSAIEAVVLPNGLAKKDVNAAGAALATCNANFGSCLSRNTAVTETQVTNYYYTEGSNSGQKVVESNTVVLDKANLKATVKEDVTVDLALKEGYPKYKFTNRYTYSDVIINDPENISNGQYTPATLEVNVTETKTYTYNGNPVQDWAVEERDGKYYMKSWATESNGGAPGGVEVQASVTYTYSYNGQTYPYTLDEDHPVVNGVGTIDNTESFSVTQEYLYTYELDNQTVELPVQNSPDDDMKYTAQHDVIYSVEARDEVEVTSDNNVIAYVNTEGTMYKATALAGISASSNIKNVTISGNINNGDISWHGASSDDISFSGDDSFESNGAVVALENWGAAPESIDLSDAVIKNYRHLRVLRNFGKDLKRVVFPKSVSRIPANCFVSSLGDGCYNLEEVVFPTDAEEFTIGAHAFQGTAIKNLLIPSEVTQLGDYAFSGCKKLYDVEMEPLKATCHFGNYVFASCDALQHVTLSEKVENIGDYQFNQCGLLESIRIPSTCKTIGSYAFYECFSIHQITIPEGVELIKQCAFENAGLTDIYLMATTPAAVPKIYAMSPDGQNALNTSTFTFQRSTGNNTAPQEHRSQMGEGSKVHYEEAISWYQEEQSGQKGLGTGNCLTAIHYPESMKPFYEAFDVTQFYTAEQLAGVTDQYGRKAWFTPAEYLAMVPEGERRNYVELELQNKKQDGTSPAYDFGTDEQGKSLYKYIPQAYAVDAFPTGHNNDPVIGPDADGLYYPNQHDYWIRLAAGATGTVAGGVNQGDIALPFASAWGWRQFPLSYSLETIGEIPFEKEYDDTWYTMCFPWKMEDNQLFMAFNQKCEIVEFVGAEVLPAEGSDTEFNLVFHFDDVAKTYYMDDNDVEYTRERDGDKVDGAGHRIYKYTSKVDQTVVTCPDAVLQPGYDPKSASEEVKEAYGKYLGIKNIMVIPGHPYMIHPSIGAAPGHPATVYINGVKKIEPGKGLYTDYTTFDAVAEKNKVERTVTSRTRTRTVDGNGVVTDTYSDPTPWKNPETGMGGKYYFIGNINDEVKDETTGKISKEGYKDLPQGCYFLGAPEGTIYPKYYKRRSLGSKLWSNYSAIILPDADAFDNVERLNGMTVTKPSGSPAKGATMEIGAWDFDEISVIDENGIATVIEDAVEKDKSAEIVRMNVVYNIKGQVVRADSGSVQGLPKGIYIVNGKKYMVK